jgi:cytochrome c oxidase subunit 2
MRSNYFIIYRREIMKKIVAILFGLTLILGLAACGSKPDASTSNAPAATSAATSTPAASAGASPSASASASPAAGGTAQAITLTATNFKYDQAEYKVKKGQPVTITLKEGEGMHGAAISEYKVNLKKDGDSATFTPDKAGTYTIQCSVMCGTGHATMKSTLIVE